VTGCEVGGEAEAGRRRGRGGGRGVAGGKGCTVIKVVHWVQLKRLSLQQINIQVKDKGCVLKDKG
jgi:hypothetical protein